MTQLPPPQSHPINYGRPDGPRQANALAIVSLVCGIIGCLVVTPFVAIITGVLALGNVRRQGGRGLAVTGILLGVLWVGVGGATYFLFNKTVNLAKTAAVDTVNALVAGDLSQAKRFSSMSEPELRAISDRVKSYGRCTGVSVPLEGFGGKRQANSDASLTLRGTATFEKGGDKTFHATLGPDANGALILRQLDVE